MKPLLPALLCLFSTSASAADAWNCQFPGHAGVWQIDGGELVAPPASGSTRFPIVRDTPEAVVALSEQFSGRRFELVMLDRRGLSIKLLVLGLDNEVEQREIGACAVPEPRAVAAARAVEDRVRPRIRSLANQAQGLAARGYTTAATVKLDETRAFDRLTPEENDLIARIRQYVASKPRR